MKTRFAVVLLLWSFLARADITVQSTTVSLDAEPLSIAATATGTGAPLDHFWSYCVGAGRANEGLRASWLEQLAFAHQACGFKYVRFHGLFHDDMFVYKEVGGVVTYNWQYLDDLFDRLLVAGVRPFVELSFCPGDLASDDRTVFWWHGHSCPPKNYDQWTALVRAFAEHCIARYGLPEVRQWYFEVWNEPNISMFWSGTKSQYFELYRRTSLALRAIDPQLRVGGPATSNFVPDDRFAGEKEARERAVTTRTVDIDQLAWKGAWIEDFLRFCAQEKLPLDFVSTHPYPTDNAFDPVDGKVKSKTRKVDSVREDLVWLKQTVARSAYPQAKLDLTEWNSSPGPRDSSHDFLQEAAYLVKVNLDCIGLAHALSFWTFTDVFEEGGAGDTIFHGGFGLINAQGIVKPSFHAYRMLNALGDQILARQDGAIVTRDSRTGKLSALLYYYPRELKTAIPRSGGHDHLDRSPAERVLALGRPRVFSVNLSACPANTRFTVDTLDQHHGFALRAWEAMGQPEPPSREQTLTLKHEAMGTKIDRIKADANGVLTWSEPLAPWTVVLITQD